MGARTGRSTSPTPTCARCYGSARAFAFLSEYEGLGLTPLEAMAAGVPAVLLDTAVARESCRDAALYVPAGDVPAVTRRPRATALRRGDARTAARGRPGACSRATTGAAPRAKRWRRSNAPGRDMDARQRPHDRGFDRHRQLQRPRRSRAVPRVAARRPAGGRSRDHRRRQRVGRRQRRRGTRGGPACRSSKPARIAASRPPTTSAFERAAAPTCCC